MRKRIITGDSVVDTIIFAEEVANILSTKINTNSNVQQVKVQKCRTVKERIGPIETRSDVDLVNISGQGSVVEAVVVSSIPDFSVNVVVDDYVIFSEPFLQLKKISNYTETVDAFTTGDGEYVVRFSNLEFNNSFKIKVIPVNRTKLRGFIYYKKC